MITREADYAIRTVLFLARKFGDDPVSTSEIGKEMLIPYRFLRKISRELILNGLAVAKRGKNGGIFLSRNPKEISIFDVINIFDKRFLSLNRCCDGTNFVCDLQQTCRLHKCFCKIQKEICEKFTKVNFYQLISDEKANK